jgi:acetyl esterase/lipase
MSLVSTTIRSLFTKSDDQRDAGLTTPDDILRYDNIAYGPDPQCQSLDVYRPRAADGQALPVIVSIHGGGWVYGDKERYQFYCMSLAQRGFAVVNFTYRLAPEHKFPAQLEDAGSVFAWVLAHSGDYGFDPSHVFAVGDSAGAHLLALYTEACLNPKLRRALPTVPVSAGFVPAGLGLHCGAYDPQQGNRQTKLLMGELLPKGGTKEELELVNALRWVTPGFPPVFLMTCTGDFLQAQATALADVLVRAYVPFQFHYYGDADHRLPHVFHCNVRDPDAARCNDDVCAFFRQLTRS